MQKKTYTVKKCLELHFTYACKVAFLYLGFFTEDYTKTSENYSRLSMPKNLSQTTPRFIISIKTYAMPLKKYSELLHPHSVTLLFNSAFSSIKKCIVSGIRQSKPAISVSF